MDAEAVLLCCEWPQGDWKQKGLQGYIQDYHNVNMGNNQQQKNIQGTQCIQAQSIEWKKIACQKAQWEKITHYPK